MLALLVVFALAILLFYDPLFTCALRIVDDALIRPADIRFHLPGIGKRRRILHSSPHC